MMLLENGKHPVLDFTNMAWKIAHKYKSQLPPAESVDDLHSHLMLTLVACSSGYEKNLNVKYETYAYKAMAYEAIRFVNLSWKATTVKGADSPHEGDSRLFINASSQIESNCDDDGRNVLDAFPCKKSTPPIKKLTDNEWDELLGVLPNEKQKMIVTMMYRRMMRLTEILKVTGLKKQRIYQLKDDAIDKIRSAVNAGKLNFLLNSYY